MEQKHDDVKTWKHFEHYWPFVRGIHLSAALKQKINYSQVPL